MNRLAGKSADELMDMFEEELLDDLDSKEYAEMFAKWCKERGIIIFRK